MHSSPLHNSNPIQKRHRNLRLTHFARELRKGQTPAEKKMWTILQQVQKAGFKFRRQHPLAPFIADFCSLKAMVIVELDGNSHADREQYDHDRELELRAMGFEILRFWNWQVFDDESRVLEKILFVCRSRAGDTVSSENDDDENRSG